MRRELLESGKAASQLEVLRRGEQDLVEASGQRLRLEEHKANLAQLAGGHQASLSTLAGVESHLVKVKDELAHLERSWVDGQAAVLANSLVQGSPCPVCGSVEHPQPAASHNDVPSDVVLKLKREEVKKIEESKDELKLEESNTNLALARAQAELNALVAQLGQLASLDPAALQTQLQTASDAVLKAEQASVQADRLGSDIETEKRVLEELKAAIEVCPIACGDCKAARTAGLPLLPSGNV